MNKQLYIATVQTQLRGRYYTSSLGIFIIVSFFIFLLLLLEIIKFAKRIYTMNIPTNQQKYLVSKIIQKQDKNPPVQTEININNKTEIDKSAFAPRTIVSPSVMENIKTSQFSIVIHREETVQQLGKSVKAIKQPYQQQPKQQRIVRFIQKVTGIIKQKLPLLSICLVNTALITSYEFLLVSLCIGVAVFVVVEILRKNGNDSIAWILDMVGHGIVISWFINLFTVGMPL